MICSNSNNVTSNNDTSSTFQELLQPNRSVSIHHKKIQTLTTEVPDVEKHLSSNHKIKQWECPECLCKLCKTYLKNIGYV